MNIVVQGIDLADSSNVLLICPDALGSEEMIQLKDILTESFPKTDFVLLSGDFQVSTTSKRLQKEIEIL